MSANFSSTKLIVHDLEKLATFYSEAYGLEQSGRLQAAIGNDPIDEIFLSKDGENSGLILMKFVERPPAATGEVALVFMTDDVAALCDRVRAAGGGVHVEPYQSDAGPYKVCFTTDPEGHLIENVQVLS